MKGLPFLPPPFTSSPFTHLPDSFVLLCAVSDTCWSSFSSPSCFPILTLIDQRKYNLIRKLIRNTANFLLPLVTWYMLHPLLAVLTTLPPLLGCPPPSNLQSLLKNYAPSPTSCSLISTCGSSSAFCTIYTWPRSTSGTCTHTAPPPWSPVSCSRGHSTWDRIRPCRGTCRCTACRASPGSLGAGFARKIRAKVPGTRGPRVRVFCGLGCRAWVAGCI